MQKLLLYLGQKRDIGWAHDIRWVQESTCSSTDGCEGQWQDGFCDLIEQQLEALTKLWTPDCNVNIYCNSFYCNINHEFQILKGSPKQAI